MKSQMIQSTESCMTCFPKVTENKEEGDSVDEGLQETGDSRCKAGEGV